MDTTAATTIGATIAVYVQLLKIAKPELESGRAILAILGLSVAGVALWVWGQTATSVVDQSWAFGIFTAIANVSLTAAGTYGLILGGINAAAKGMLAIQQRANGGNIISGGHIVSTSDKPKRVRKPRTPQGHSMPPEPTRPLPNTGAVPA